jgi:hypothetical protein
MKGAISLSDFKAKRKTEPEEVWVKPKPCIVCGTVVVGPYGRDSEDNWTCNSHCEKEYRHAFIFASPAGDTACV